MTLSLVKGHKVSESRTCKVRFREGKGRGAGGGGGGVLGTLSNQDKIGCGIEAIQVECPDTRLK